MRNWRELAVFGGSPAFLETKHVGQPNIADRTRILRRIDDILKRKWLTNNGRYVQQFEKKVAQKLNVKHCIAMCNGTVALEIATRSLGMKGEVIIPSFTFVATAHCLQWQEITPVFCDVSPLTGTIDIAKIEERITSKTTGIIGVHLWGRPCDIDGLQRLSKKHGIKLLFDASHAFGCSYKGRLIGSFGDAETVSFHATKFINTMEGGAVLTNDDELAAKIRLMKNFGFAGMDNVIYLGINGKMNEVSAAVGISSLESMEEFVDINHRNYELYRKNLDNIPGIRIRLFDEKEQNNYQYIIIDVDEGAAGMSRDLIMKILHAENIRVRRYFYPGCHQMEPYRSLYPNTGTHLPATETLAARVLCLPTGSAIQPEDVETICSTIRLVIENNLEIKGRLLKQ